MAAINKKRQSGPKKRRNNQGVFANGGKGEDEETGLLFTMFFQLKNVFT